MKHFIYDLETYPNIFLAGFRCCETGQVWIFEISARRDDTVALMEFLRWLKGVCDGIVGFNSQGFDYPIIHLIMEADQFFNYHPSKLPTCKDLYDKAQSMIDADWGDKFKHIIWENEQHIKNIDLFLIHHFDNKNRRNGLKDMEFNLAAPDIYTLPIKPGTYCDEAEMDQLRHYLEHGDLVNTHKFYNKSVGMIEARIAYQEKFNMQCMNYNDGKIGLQYFVKRLEEVKPGSCYIRQGFRKVARGTPRAVVHLKDCIFDIHQFDDPKLQEMLNYLKGESFDPTKDLPKRLEALHVKALDIDIGFGLGGLHASVPSQIIRSSDDVAVYDADVTSYYPSLPIGWRFYPEHLGEAFCDVYKTLKEERLQYPKGTTENAMLKLSLNFVFGQTKLKSSPVYDPQYFYTTTLNGQFFILKLAEVLAKAPGIRIIQINTDGLTIACAKADTAYAAEVFAWWEKYSRLDLEFQTYRAMFIKNVSAYIAVDDKGKVKRKKDYEWNLEIHKNFSRLVVPKIAEQVLLHGGNVSELVRNHPSLDDFFIKAKSKGEAKLYLDGKEIQKISRYYVSKTGGSLTKVSLPPKGALIGSWKRANKLSNKYYEDCLNNPPLSGPVDDHGTVWDERIHTKGKTKHELSEEKIEAGFKVKLANKTKNIDRNDINFDYYIEKVNDLVLPLIKELPT